VRYGFRKLPGKENHAVPNGLAGLGIKSMVGRMNSVAKKAQDERNDDFLQIYAVRIRNMR
jgi:hypothetical protein